MPRAKRKEQIRQRQWVDPGFTPSVRDGSALVELLADDELAKSAEAAIVRAGPAMLGVLRERFEQAGVPLRGRLLRAIGRFAESSDARALLISALDDPDAKTRRNAAIALGHSRAEGVEDALSQTWDRDARPEMRRSIAASLGKIGSPKSLPLLREAARSDDPQLARLAERAILMIERTESRSSRGRLDGKRIPDEPVDVDVFARRGLEELLTEELRRVSGVTDTRVAGPGRVRARLAGAMQALFAARTMASFRFPLPSVRQADGEAQSEAVARAATSPVGKRIVSTWTVGPARYRIDWEQGGHRRAATWETARAIKRLAPELFNDPTQSLWELSVVVKGGCVDAALVARALEDPRFRWRRRDVPAASHPTLAAALVHLAGLREDDVVWDPFVGSGSELIERGLAGLHRSLLGSDLHARALDAARENMKAAGVRGSLEQADALVHAPEGVTLIITNPPMGRRSARVPRVADMLDEFVVHAARLLVPGGRLVWIAPWPKRARNVGAGAGLELERAIMIDMGGFDAEIQRWTKRHA